MKNNINKYRNVSEKLEKNASIHLKLACKYFRGLMYPPKELTLTLFSKKFFVFIRKRKTLFIKKELSSADFNSI